VGTLVYMDCTLPSLGFEPMPYTTRGPTGQYHSAIWFYCLTGELSHNPKVRLDCCECDSILKLHGAEVGPLSRQGYAAGKPQT
jgi:hypothetical protein